MLVFLVATQAFSKWVLLLEFKWNQDFIAKNLCENRTRPKLKCGGKCQLMKRLAEEEKENAPAQIPSGKSNFQEAPFTAAPLDFSIQLVNAKTALPFPHLKHWKSFVPPCSVFHPPLV